MVAALPDWDRFNNPKKKKKTRRVKNVEKILMDEPDEVNEEEAVEQGCDDAENQAVIGSEKEKVDGAEKERRTKKINERPSSDDEDNATLGSRLLLKKQKTVGIFTSKASERPEKGASKASKGMSSEPNVSSIPEAQFQPTPTIDFTKPIYMILPNPQPETVNVSSTSEDTWSDSSIQRIIASGPESAPTMSSESQEVVSDDNSILNHLSYHISGDTFTSSTLNSPAEQINNATHMHVDTEFIIPPNSSQIPEPQTLETISETHIPEQQNEIPQENLIPDHITETPLPEPSPVPHFNIYELCDASTIFNLEHNIPLSPISIELLPPDSLPKEQIIPLYKPLSLDEIVIPYDQILPILETLTMNSVDIESSSNLSPVSALKKIQIKPLKRQRSSPKPKPKPKLPYKKPYLFLNQNYEPDLEF
jgi:hypothetical protein